MDFWTTKERAVKKCAKLFHENGNHLEDEIIEKWAKKAKISIKELETLIRREVTEDIKITEICPEYQCTPPVGFNTNIGDKVQIKMESGKTALWRVKKIESAWNVDWSWFILEFWEYLDLEEHNKRMKEGIKESRGN